MMKTIRQRFYIVAILLCLLLGLNYGSIIYYFNLQEKATQRKETATVINQKTDELEKDLWAMRFWEKSIRTQHPEATQYFAQSLADIRDNIKPLESKLSDPDIKKNVQEFTELLANYEEAFNELIQISTDQQLNHTDLVSDYHMLISNILMGNNPRLIKLLFNMTRFQGDYFDSRKKTKYKGLMIVIGSIERQTAASNIMNDRLRAYFTSYSNRLAHDWNLEQNIKVINDIIDGITLKLTDNLSSISHTAVKRVTQENQHVKNLFGKLKTTSLLIAVSGILIFFIVIYILSRTIVRPIGELSKVVNRVKSGDMEARFMSEGKDEISQLGRTFNDMVDSVTMQSVKLRAYQLDLEKNIEELDLSKKELQKHRHHLEELVENRTKDLEIANKQLQQEILEREQMEKALRIAKEAAEAANITKSEFLANMSHEIRTPLNAVLGFLELVLEDSSLSGDQLKHLRTAQTAANILLSLINDILDISKLERGKLTIEHRPFSLHQLMKEIHQTVKLQVQEKGLKLQFDIGPVISGSFLGDSFRLRQIITNLVSNAIKFTEEGGVSIRVIPAEEKSQLQFTIEDTGIGIPADRLSQIFEPFSQADMSTTRRFGGTGLGTTIARELVELMGGQIWAESEVGKGSTFHFTINITPTEQIPEEADPFSVAGRNVSPGSLRRFRILLVEDVKANVDLAKIRLSQQGHEVTVAWNGREAVDQYQQGEFDVILMDIHMPEMNGTDATKRIRELEAEFGGRVPIIAMTAGVMKEETEQYLEVGMDTIVAKPVDFEKLFTTIETVVPKDAGAIIPSKIQDKLKVLVVDDEPANLKLLDQLLQDQYRLSFAVNGKKVLESVGKIKPDIILIDVMMPEMDGYEVCRQLKENPETKNIPVIFLSELLEDEEKVKGLNFGAIDFITKPFESSEIQVKVKQHLLNLNA